MISVRVQLELPAIPDRLRVKSFKVSIKSLEQAYADRQVEVDIADLDEASIRQLADEWTSAFLRKAEQRRQAAREDPLEG